MTTTRAISAVAELHMVVIGCTSYRPNSAVLSCIHYSAPAWERSIAISLSVCLSASIYLEPLDRFSRFFVQIPYDRGSVLLWWRCDMLCTSGILDDVMFGRNGLFGDTWRLHVSATTTSGVAIPGRSLMSKNALFFRVVVLCLLVNNDLQQESNEWWLRSLNSMRCDRILQKNIVFWV